MLRIVICTGGFIFFFNKIAGKVVGFLEEPLSIEESQGMIIHIFFIPIFLSENSHFHK